MFKAIVIRVIGMKMLKNLLGLGLLVVGIVAVVYVVMHYSAQEAIEHEVRYMEMNVDSLEQPIVESLGPEVLVTQERKIKAGSQPTHQN